jgi:hypothetical protein
MVPFYDMIERQIMRVGDINSLDYKYSKEFIELLFHFLYSLKDRLAVFCQQEALTFIFLLSVHT